MILGKNNKSRARSLSGQGIKKGQDDKAKIEEKKKIKHRKSKNIWELLGDAELADAERQYLEAVHQVSADNKNFLLLFFFLFFSGKKNMNPFQRWINY